MLNKRKSQIALEYMMLVGLGLVIVTVALSIAGVYFQDSLDDRNRAVINDFALSIQNELILAAQVEEGYVRVLTLPDDVDDVEYDISNTDTSLTVNYFKNGVVKGGIVLVTPMINGTLLEGRDNNITNENGTVRINKI